MMRDDEKNACAYDAYYQEGQHNEQPDRQPPNCMQQPEKHQRNKAGYEE